MALGSAVLLRRFQSPRGRAGQSAARDPHENIAPRSVGGDRIGAGAWGYVLVGACTRKHLAALTLRHAIPAICQFLELAAAWVGLGRTRSRMGSGNQAVSNTLRTMSASRWGRIWVPNACSKVWNSYAQFSARCFGNTACCAFGITPFRVII